jgi:hypothetical protein
VTGFTLDDFDEVSQMMLREMIDEDLKRCREINALPRWRWLRRSTLRAERREWGEEYRWTWDHAEQIARDEILLGRRTP